MLPDSPNLELCGTSRTYPLVKSTDRSQVAGQLVVSQTADARLYVTARLDCPYALRPVTSGSPPSQPFTMGVNMKAEVAGSHTCARSME